MLFSTEMEALRAPAENALRNSLRVKEGERLLIVTDRNKLKIADALYDAALSLGARPHMLIMEPAKINGEEPSETVAEAMKIADVVLAPTTRSLTHTNARREACKKGARIVTLPGILEDTFRRALDVDYEEMEAVTRKLAKLLSEARNAQLRSPSGTALALHLGNEGRAACGTIRTPGQCGNLPAGEAITAPVSCDGIVVIDRMGSLVTEPTRVVFSEGYAREIQDNESGRRLRALLEEAKSQDGNENAAFIAEFAMGTNPKAKVIGNVLEDEKVLGTAHIAFGDNTSYPGGRNYSVLHQDGIIFKPTIELDGRTIMENGELRV